MVNLTKEDKEEMLLDAIIMAWRTRNAPLAMLVGHSLSYYNYEQLFVYLNKLDKEYMKQGADSFLYSEYGSKDYVSKFKKIRNIKSKNK